MRNLKIGTLILGLLISNFSFATSFAAAPVGGGGGGSNTSSNNQVLTLHPVAFASSKVASDAEKLILVLGSWLNRYYPYAPSARRMLAEAVLGQRTQRSTEEPKEPASICVSIEAMGSGVPIIPHLEIEQDWDLNTLKEKVAQVRKVHRSHVKLLIGIQDVTDISQVTDGATLVVVLKLDFPSMKRLQELMHDIYRAMPYNGRYSLISGRSDCFISDRTEVRQRMRSAVKSHRRAQKWSQDLLEDMIEPMVQFYLKKEGGSLYENEPVLKKLNVTLFRKHALKHLATLISYSSETSFAGFYASTKQFVDLFASVTDLVEKQSTTKWIILPDIDNIFHKPSEAAKFNSCLEKLKAKSVEVKSFKIGGYNYLFEASRCWASFFKSPLGPKVTDLLLNIREYRKYGNGGQLDLDHNTFINLQRLKIRELKSLEDLRAIKGLAAPSRVKNLVMDFIYNWRMSPIGEEELAALEPIEGVESLGLIVDDASHVHFFPVLKRLFPNVKELKICLTRGISKEEVVAALGSELMDQANLEFVRYIY